MAGDVWGTLSETSTAGINNGITFIFFTGGDFMENGKIKLKNNVISKLLFLCSKNHRNFKGLSLKWNKL